MATVGLRIPQVGEGLQEARLVAVLKQPGDSVRRDEPIYQMETDKAIMDVESPYEGVLLEWLAQADDVLPIGAEVARMEINGEVTEAPVQRPTVTTAGAESTLTVGSEPPRNATIPPRTRAYAKEKGIPGDVLATMKAAGAKLMPEDVDRYLAALTKTSAFSERSLGAKQRVLASRLMRGNQLVVPGTMSMVADWGPIEELRAKIKASDAEFQPSAFTMFAYAVVRCLVEHELFRSTLVGDDRVRTYRHVHLGIAVALPGDELVLAVVEEADTLDWPRFASYMRERIEEARSGKDQVSEAVTVSLTNMQSFAVRDGVPVVVPPAVGTLLLGEVYSAQDPNALEPMIRRNANLSLTFDHRMVNGVGAAEFLKSVRDRVEDIGSLLR